MKKNKKIEMNDIKVYIGDREITGLSISKKTIKQDIDLNVEFTVSFTITGSQWNPPYKLEKIVLVKDENQH